MTDKRAKTELFSQWTQGNLVIADQGQSTGDRFWVDDSGTDTTGYGKSPGAPFATLDYAATLAGEGDRIYVMEGHAETILLATTCNLATAGVHVIGLGKGASRPTFTFATSNAATMTVDAASVTIENLVFVCAKDGLTKLLDINAADCTVLNCEFRNDASYQAVTMIDVTSVASAAARTHIAGCKITSITAGATNGIELGEVNDGIVIEDCLIYGDWTNAGIHNPTGKVLTNLTIRNNVIANTQTGDHAIELVSACTGQCADNRLFGSTIADVLDPGSLMCNGNKGTDAVDQAGRDVPLTSATTDFDTENFAADFLDATLIDSYALVSLSFATDTFDSRNIADYALLETVFATYALDTRTFAADFLDATLIDSYALVSLSFATGAFDSRNIASYSLLETAFATDALDTRTFAADFLDATLIDSYALVSLSFATGAFDSRNIASYSLLETVFATDALDTRTFAADFLDNTLIADYALAVENFATDAFDSSKFADGAFDSSHYAADAVTKIGGAGYLVNRATADTFDTATTALFTIGTGKVLMLGIIGTVTTNIEAAACAIKLEANGTAGTTSDLCATLDINNAQAGTTWGITGTAATALVAAVGGGAPWPSTPIVLEAGTLDLTCAADNTGSAKWDIWYIPLEAGATVVST